MFHVRAVLSSISGKFRCRKTPSSVRDREGYHSSGACMNRVIGMHTDFISLLSVIFSNTNLSIALDSSQPTYSAALIPPKDLITHSSTLASNASSFLPNAHCRSLTTEVHSTARDVLVALQDLVYTHLSLLANPSNKHDAVAVSKSSPKNGNDAYLIKTGVVHELVTQAKVEDPPPKPLRSN